MVCRERGTLRNCGGDCCKEGNGFNGKEIVMFLRWRCRTIGGNLIKVLDAH